MRKLVLLCFVVSVFSCTKESLKERIAGTWEYETYSGYPFNQPTLPPGNGRIIVIGEDGSFERRQHDTLLFRGTYKILKKKDCYERDTDMTFSTSEGSPADYQYIKVVDGKLTLSTPNCYQDGGTVFYRRLK